MPHAVVIYNPIAGEARSELASGGAQERLEAAGFTVERVATLDRDGARPMAARAAGRADRVIAVGGDGTLREVVEGLGAARGDVLVGVVPMGNANIVAHELRVPRETNHALDVIVNGRPIDVDLGRVRTDAFESLFLAVVGVGWDAHTVRLLEGLRHSRFGRLGYRFWADGLYGVAGLAAAARLRQERFRITVDGRDIGEGTYCAAFLCNLRTYAKRMAVAPDAHHASGLIHVQARKKASLPYLLWQLASGRRARRVPAFISDYVEGERFVLRGERPFQVQVDGDDRGRTSSLEVTVLPRAVRFLAPAEP